MSTVELAPQVEPPGEPEPDRRRVRELEARLASLEARFAALERKVGAGARAPVEAVAYADEPGTPSRAAGATPSTTPATVPTSLLPLAGYLCLIFAGAYVVRSLTDARTVPASTGVAIGLAYAALWAVVAERTAAKGKRLHANALTISAVLIAYPLLWEATIGFRVLSPATSAALVAAVSTTLMIVAWRGSLYVAAWAVALSFVGTGLSLLIATEAPAIFAPVFVVLGGAVVWLTYGRRWHALRWPLALAADASVLIVVVKAGNVDAVEAPAAAPAIALSIALAVVYLGSFVIRILQRHRAVNVFEAVQGTLALAVGFGGAFHVAYATGAGALGLGAAALGAGLACYVASFAFVAKQSDAGANFVYFTSLALVLVVTASIVLVGGVDRTWGFLGLGLATSVLGRRHHRSTLLAHGAVYLSAAAITSELAARAGEVFLRTTEQPESPLTAPIVVTLATVAAVHAALAGRADAWPERLPSLVAALWTAVGLGTLAVVGLAHLLPGSPPEAGAEAAVRTGVLGAAAILAAAVVRLHPRSELRWLVYPLLGLAALKLFALDLPRGRPLTLFPSLAIVGVAVLVAPWLVRRATARDQSPTGPEP